MFLSQQNNVSLPAKQCFAETKTRSWFVDGSKMIRRCLLDNFLFPRWEQNIPSLGTKHSQAGNKTDLRIAVDEISLTNGQSVAMQSSRASRDFSERRSECGVAIVSSLTRFLRPLDGVWRCNRLVITLLLMMVVGVNEVKADDITEGLYYIASKGKNYTYDSNTYTANYYLCPTENWYNYKSTSPYHYQPDNDNPDNGMPFMTTYQCRNEETEYESKKALWVVKESSTAGWYYIIHLVDGKYLTYNKKMDSGKEGRMRVHLEASPSEDAKLWSINWVSQFDSYDIISKLVSNSYKYLNVNDGNKQSLVADGKTDGPNGIATGGIIGLWQYGAYYAQDESKNDQNSRWQPESTTLSGPAISKVNANNTITITDNNNLSNCTTIRYTIGDGSQDAPTATTGAEYDPLTPPVITDETNVKAAVFAYGVRVSDVSNAWLNQTITLSDESLVYNGSEREPSVTVKYGNETIPAEEYDVEYSDNTAAGTATVTVTNKAGGNFYVITDSKEFEITKAPLTVTANPKEINYGDAPANDGVTYTGLVNSETSSVLGGVLDYDYTYSQYNNVGNTYTITPKGLTSNNYNISFVAGMLTVTPKILTVTAVAKSKTYGEADPALTYTSNGLVNNDAITGALTRVEGENAGTYAINQGTISASTNYDISYTGANLTINPKSLTVTANNHNITYGEAPAGNGVTYSGFVGEQTAAVLGGTLDYDYSYAQYGDVGNTYTITPKGLSSTNYDISFVAGTLTVNQREVGIEWGNTSLGYNGSSQTPIATATNLVNNDEIAVTVTGGQTDVGTGYTATATGLTGAKAGNYKFPSSNPTTTFSIGPGTFTPTISIEGWTYGDASNTPSVSGNASGGDVTYSYSVKGENNYSATVPTHAGSYTLKVTIAAKGNYESAEATTNFTISPKSIGDGTDAATGIDIKMTQVDDNVEVTYVKDGTTTLTVDEDYTVEIQTQGDDNHVIVTGIGNYTGSVQGLFVKSVFTKPTGVTEAAAVYQASSDLANPDGITPYIVRKVNPSIGTMVITPIDYIPKDVPVLMLRTSETTGFLASPKDEATLEITAQTKNSNQLKVAPDGGVDVEAAQTYMFYQGEFVLTKKGTLSAGKFFLYNPNFRATPPAEEEQQQGGGNAPSFSVLRFVIEEESTGIDDIKDETLNIKNGSAWYTLDGRKLSGKPTKAGLYIKNGHKTIINRK